MTAVADTLPLTETHVPQDQATLAALVAGAFASGTPIYPIGGGTSLDYGLSAAQEGLGISLAKLNRVVDYPAADMTITVEAGITLAELSAALAAENQWLPIDAPQSSQATLGGLMATAFAGPRRYGYGTMRDYVIGVSAVDGRGTPFKAGGRVVKNVAGYDFCKLLTGSLGTLGIVTQVTLKVRPRPERSAFLVGDVRDADSADKLLAGLVDTATTPAAIEWLVGSRWREHAGMGVAPAGCIGRLAVGLEGSAVEVDWMLARLSDEWREAGLATSHILDGDRAAGLWTDLAEFPAEPGASLVLKASVLPSQTLPYVKLVREIDPAATVQAHAGNGVVIARFEKFEATGVSRDLIGRLHPAATAASGSAVVLSNSLEGLTHPAVWGNATAAHRWMSKVKQQFDPRNLLNPGRFVHE
ncbi:MAG: FAD-binding oxidoreductase [Planctomycetota bacterium]|nr:MAG: FAD-binding oxidoreductase [Planctomycetota bacterium]